MKAISILIRWEKQVRFKFRLEIIFRRKLIIVKVAD